jgi:hypothetical protein
LRYAKYLKISYPTHSYSIHSPARIRSTEPTRAHRHVNAAVGAVDHFDTTMLISAMLVSAQLAFTAKHNELDEHQLAVG